MLWTMGLNGSEYVCVSLFWRKIDRSEPEWVKMSRSR